MHKYCHEELSSLSYFYAHLGFQQNRTRPVTPKCFYWEGFFPWSATFGSISCQLIECWYFLVPKIFRVQERVKEDKKKSISWLLDFNLNSLSQVYTAYLKRSKKENNSLLILKMYPLYFANSPPLTAFNVIELLFSSVCSFYKIVRNKKFLGTMHVAEFYHN